MRLLFKFETAYNITYDAFAHTRAGPSHDVIPNNPLMPVAIQGIN
jgi:hypothetical protein